jgi:uncharacterized protein DUF4915
LSHEADDCLLISAPRPGSGGLFVLDGGSVTAIDRIATQGISVRDGRLARIISSGRIATPCGDVLVYDRDGLRRSYRIDGMGIVHDALYAMDALLIVNTAGNAIEALREDGSASTWWQGPPRYDAWHINCLASDGASVVATAFGQGAHSSAWRDPDGAGGIIIRLPEETVLVRGLDKPHDPRRIDGLWVVCQSGQSQVLGFDDDGGLQKTCTLGGFTRGLAYDARYLYVGESRLRQHSGSERWSLVNVLDRETWQVVDAFEVPVAEIYALVCAPRSLVAGARLGLAGAPDAVRSEGPLSRLSAAVRSSKWQISDMVLPGSRRFTVDADVPHTLVANSHLKLTCRITNHSDVCIDSAGPFPVDLSYRWDGADGIPVRQAIRTELPHELAPGLTCDTEMLVAVPDRCGAFGLTLCLTQADAAWPNAFATESFISHGVTVVEGRAISIADTLAPTAWAGDADADAGDEVTLLATDCGVFVLSDGACTLVDAQPTVALRSDGTKLYRSIAGKTPAALDLVVYDRRGAVGVQRGAGTAARASEPVAKERELVGAGVSGSARRRSLRDRPHERAPSGANVRDVAVVPAALVRGLSTGFRTNPTRVREEAHLARFRELELEPVTLWASTGTLWPGAMAVVIRASVPAQMVAGEERLLSYKAANTGNGWLVPGKPHAVAASYRWYDAQGKQAGRDATSLRTPLPRTLGPGETLAGSVRVLAPKRAGHFNVLITFLQEQVAWFSDVCAASGFVAEVVVVER